MKRKDSFSDLEERALEKLAKKQVDENVEYLKGKGEEVSGWQVKVLEHMEKRNILNKTKNLN